MYICKLFTNNISEFLVHIFFSAGSRSEQKQRWFSITTNMKCFLYTPFPPSNTRFTLHSPSKKVFCEICSLPDNCFVYCTHSFSNIVSFSLSLFVLLLYGGLQFIDNHYFFASPNDTPNVLYQPWHLSLFIILVLVQFSHSFFTFIPFQSIPNSYPFFKIESCLSSFPIRTFQSFLSKPSVSILYTFHVLLL